MSRLARVITPVLVLAFVFAPAVTPADEPESAKAADSAEVHVTETVVEELVVPPQVIIKSQVPPDYPPAALAARFEGVVVVELTVLADGTVGNAKVVKCTHPNIGFEEAAIAATKKWRFEAAMKEGVPIDYASTFRVNFRVAGGEPYVSWGASGTITDSGSRPPVRHETSITTPGKR